MDYAGGSAGLTGSNVGTCPACGWTGPGRDAPFHECRPPADEVIENACQRTAELFANAYDENWLGI